MHVNSQWDLEYRGQEEAFRRYREDSQLATKENHETIADMKENEALKKMKELYLREPLSAESNATLPEELCHHEKHEVVQNSWSYANIRYMCDECAEDWQGM